MEDLISIISQNVFNSNPNKVEAIVDKGKNNQVYKVVIDGATYILRLLNSEEQLNTYNKEKWCAKVAMDAGVKTPQITHTGILDGWSYSFQEHIEGTSGTESDVKEVWFALGQYAKSIHQIPADEIALDYHQKLEALFSNDFFVEKEIFSPELSEKVKNRLKETCLWEFMPMLCHGNLHPSNVMVDTEEVVWLIDWETATGNTVPCADLAEIYTWNNGKENIAKFCEGYELTNKDVEMIMRDVQTLVLLRLVEVIQRMVFKFGGSVDPSNDYIRDTVQRLEKITDFQTDILFTKNL